MTFEIEINGRMRTVAVETAGPPDGRFQVTVDGATQTVDAVQVEADTLSLIFPEQDHVSHEIGFSDGLLPGELDVYLHTGTLKAVVNGRRSRRAAEAAATGEQRVVALMPGRVARVLAAPGQDVAARQPLVVVEAMKMENELTSPKAGRVKEVAITEGASVEAGRLLVIVE
jgi:acetyl/propionyl-CoA carboxylase alpha subunit